MNPIAILHSLLTTGKQTPKPRAVPGRLAHSDLGLVSDEELGVLGSGFMVWVSGFRFSGSGFRVQQHIQVPGGGTHLATADLSCPTNQELVDFFFPPPAYAGIHPTLFLFEIRIEIIGLRTSGPWRGLLRGFSEGLQDLQILEILGDVGCWDWWGGL